MFLHSIPISLTVSFTMLKEAGEETRAKTLLSVLTSESWAQIAQQLHTEI